MRRLGVGGRSLIAVICLVLAPFYAGCDYGLEPPETPELLGTWVLLDDAENEETVQFYNYRSENRFVVRHHGLPVTEGTFKVVGADLDAAPFELIYAVEPDESLIDERLNEHAEFRGTDVLVMSAGPEGSALHVYARVDQ